MSTSVVCSPNWRPLERLLLRRRMLENSCIWAYRARSSCTSIARTRRYLNIHAESGEFYLHGNCTYMKVSKAAALAYVFG